MNRGGCALTGDWGKLRSFLRAGQEFVDGVNEVLEEEAHKIRDAVAEEIPFNSVPNAKSTVARKGSNTPLEESGVYKGDGIIVNEYGSRDRGNKKYYVIQGNDKLQVGSGDRDHDGITYADLLEIMENGSSVKGIPARPVLTITFDHMKSSLESEIIAKSFSKIHEAIR